MYQRTEERRPVNCWCKICGEQYVVHANRITTYHLRFEGCAFCAAKRAAKQFPLMGVKKKMNGVKRWPAIH